MGMFVLLAWVITYCYTNQLKQLHHHHRYHYLAIERIVSSLPDGLGRGTFIWEATSPDWGKLFDRSGAASAALDDYNR